jgi:dihydroflavonol-4-reductase
MRIVVLGASGHIGSAIVREFAHRGHLVTGTGRTQKIPKNLSGVNFRYCAGDIDSNDHLEQLVASNELVVDAAAPYSLNLFATANDAQKHPVDYAERRTERLLTCVLKNNAALVYVSSSVTEPKKDDTSLSSLQSKAVRRFYPYFKIKKHIEKRIRASVADGLGAIVVRPTTCIGPWDARPREMCWIPKLLSAEIPATLRHKINVVDTRDLAATIASAVESGIRGQTVIASGHNTTTDELMGQLCESAGVAAPQWGMPAEMSVLPLMWTELLWATIGKPSPLPSLVSALLCEQQWLEPDPMLKSLGILPRPLADTARDTVAWYRGLGYC